MSNGTEPSSHYIRVNVLIATAVVIVILCLFVVVQLQIKDEFAKGILTLVLGRFLGYVDNIYNYEFGTTRISAKKDETITEMTKTAAVVATTAQAEKKASELPSTVTTTVTTEPAAPVVTPGPENTATGIVPAAESLSTQPKGTP